MSVRKKQRVYDGETRFVYEARWKDPKTGKWPSKTFRTKKAADAYHAAMVDQTRRGIFVCDRDTVTFAKAWAAYSDDLEMRCRAGDVGALTVKGYRAHARRILPEFGNYKLTEIDNDLVRPFIYRRAAIERWNYVRHDLIVISLVLDFGVRQKWLARNALKDDPIQRPRNARLRHVKEPTVAQVHQLISALARGPEYGDHLVTFYNAKLVVALDTLGLRNGEHCGLHWEDVGFDTGWLTIRHARTRQGVLKAPKSGKSRQLPLPQGVRNALWEHCLRQGSPTTGPVLLARDGKPANPCQISDHYFPFAMRRAGLVDPDGKPNKADELPTLFSSHSLRRFCASYQKRSGVPLDEIQAFLGHSRPDTTQQYIYWQRSIDASERALGKLTADIGLHRLTDATAPELSVPGQIEITLPPEPAPSQMRIVRGSNGGTLFERPRHRTAILASAVSLLEQGRSIPAIAAEIGMCSSTLRLWLYQEGICQPRDTSERQALVVRLYREGVDVREIGRRVGCATPAIYHWIKKAGVPMRGRRSPVDYTDRRLLAIELYRQGVPVLEISARCSVSNGCIYEWIKEAGVQHRGRGKWTNNARPPRPHPQRDAAVAMYNAGTRVPAIAEQCGVAHRTVFQWLKEGGVKMRMDGGRPKAASAESTRQM